MTKNNTVDFGVLVSIVRFVMPINSDEEQRRLLCHSEHDDNLDVPGWSLALIYTVCSVLIVWAVWTMFNG